MAWRLWKREDIETVAEMLDKEVIDAFHLAGLLLPEEKAAIERTRRQLEHANRMLWL